MTSIIIAVLSIVVLLILIIAGVHIAFALAFMSLVGVWLITGNFMIALSILSSTAYEAIRSYIFVVVPLFILMGILMSDSGAAGDLFGFVNRFTKRVPGGMAVATIGANAIFAAVTGISVASAAVFSRVALPEMDKLNYKKSFAVGTIAGSSILGFLIPPSVLLIIYGMLAEQSIGKLFIAGVIPGLLLASIYTVGVVSISLLKPEIVQTKTVEWNNRTNHKIRFKELVRIIALPLPVILLIVLVFGGIWGGLFTPTEASAIGALGALIIALIKKTKLKNYSKALFGTATATASIFILMIAAQMYSRMLTLSGAVTWLTNMIIGFNLPGYSLLLSFLILWVLLGCILDSTSILLLTMPLILPIATYLEFDLIWFGIVTIITVEIGLLTPPFGMVLFAIKATLGDYITVNEIVRGSIPFLFMMIIALVLVILFPILATWLPGLI